MNDAKEEEQARQMGLETWQAGESGLPEQHGVRISRDGKGRYTHPDYIGMGRAWRRMVATFTAEGRVFLVVSPVVCCQARLLEEAVTYASDRSLVSCKAGMTSLPSSSMERITSLWAICPSLP